MRNAHETEFARHLRRNMTDAEREIWHHLRNRALMGPKFRRQYPVGPYIVDFACPARRLVVELDGGQHDEAVAAPRTRDLDGCDSTILRFWNNELFDRPATVFDGDFLGLFRCHYPNH